MTDQHKALASREEAPATPLAATPAAPGEEDAAKKLWETIKILGLSNEKLALQAITAALSHLAPVAAPASVAQAIDQLVSTLAESKGWMRDYARALIEDAIDRRHLEVAAPAPASEAVAWQGRPSPDQRWQDVPAEYLDFRRDIQAWEIRPLYAHLTGDSADAPVQQAGGERMSFEKAMVAAGYNKPERGAHANSGYLYQRDEDRFVGWELRAALKGEQPVEPSGSERDEVAHIEAVAKILAERLDYPWAHMPEKGRNSFRADAKAVLATITTNEKKDPTQ